MHKSAGKTLDDRFASCERTSFGFHLGWLNTVLRAVIGNSRDGACFNLDKQTWQRKKQWTTEDDFSKSPH